jgi:hypothetical protein
MVLVNAVIFVLCCFTMASRMSPASLPFLRIPSKSELYPNTISGGALRRLPSSGVSPRDPRRAYIASAAASVPGGGYLPEIIRDISEVKSVIAAPRNTLCNVFSEPLVVWIDNKKAYHSFIQKKYSNEIDANVEGRNLVITNLRSEVVTNISLFKIIRHL